MIFIQFSETWCFFYLIFSFNITSYPKVSDYSKLLLKSTETGSWQQVSSTVLKAFLCAICSCLNFIGQNLIT